MCHRIVYCVNSVAENTRGNITDQLLLFHIFSWSSVLCFYLKIKKNKKKKKIGSNTSIEIQFNFILNLACFGIFFAFM